MKFALFRGGTAILRGEAEGLGRTPSVSAADPVGRQLQSPDLAGKSYEGALGMLLDWLNRQAGGGRIAAAGHRIVHGGLRFADPVRIDAGVLAELRQIVPLAPLHQPHGLAAVSAIARSQPSLLQVACFDTAFHRTMPDVATRLALPRDLGGPSLRRYGFHGLSYEFIAARLRELSPALAQGRVVAAHLGSGASLCAMQGGRSIETTMGFSTLDGLVMGTRPGALDAGVVLYLLQSCGMTDKEVEDVLYHRSGLLGVSGVSGDMRALAASTSPRARARPSSCSPTGPRARSHGWPPLSAGWTAWSSPAASASTTPPCAPGSAAVWPGWASPPRNCPAPPRPGASAPRQATSRSGSSPPTRRQPSPATPRPFWLRDIGRDRHAGTRAITPAKPPGIMAEVSGQPAGTPARAVQDHG